MSGWTSKTSTYCKWAMKQSGSTATKCAAKCVGSCTQFYYWSTYRQCYTCPPGSATVPATTQSGMTLYTKVPSKCPANSFGAASSSTCTKCPVAGSTAPVGSLSRASCACANGYVVKSGKCVSSGWTSKANTVCWPNTKQSGSFTATTCGTKCVGSCTQFSRKGTYCYICKPGSATRTYNGCTLYTKNSKCAASFYGAWRSSTCSKCPTGRVSAAGSLSLASCKCPANTYMISGTCSKCPTTSTSAIGSNSLTNCKCLANTYMISGACNKCPTSSSSAAGSTGPSACACIKGHIVISGKCVMNKVCPVGQYGVDTCADCPAGKTTTGAPVLLRGGSGWVTVKGFKCKKMGVKGRSGYTQPGSVAACKASCKGGCKGVMWNTKRYCYKCSDASKGGASSNYDLYQRPFIGATAASQCTVASKCAANKYLKSGACSKCPISSASAAGSTSLGDCKCAANNYLKSGICNKCPTSSASAAGSTSLGDCKCAANNYLKSRACSKCPISSASAAGSTSPGDCKCAANNYLKRGSCRKCPTSSASAAGSTSIGDCACTTKGHVIISGKCLKNNKVCPAGKFGGSTCANCPAGKTTTYAPALIFGSTEWKTTKGFGCSRFDNSPTSGSLAACKSSCSGACPGFQWNLYQSQGKYCRKCTDDTAASGSTTPPDTPWAQLRTNSTLFKRPQTGAAVSSQCTYCATTNKKFTLWKDCPCEVGKYGTRSSSGSG